MRYVLIVLVALAAACTKPNPNTCCTTEAQCAALGASELRPCDVGQACGTDFQCVAAECATSAECPSDRPICQNELCVGACTSNDDCADVAGRSECASDGVCVGCTDSSQCSGTTAICDPKDRACRGCERDDECASGVCIEAEGTCADEGSILWLRQFGDDQGQCTKTTPCATLAAAVSKVTPTRNILRVEGGSVDTGTTKVVIGTKVVVDGTGARLSRPLNAPLFEVVVGGILTAEGFTFTAASNPAVPTIAVMQGGTVRIFASTLENAAVEVTNGSLAIDSSTLHTAGFTETLATCTSGTISVHRTHFENAELSANNCQVTVSRSYFDERSDGSVRTNGGLVLIENNVIVMRYELSDSMAVYSAAPGSSVRFNTFVNTSGIESDGVALFCDDTVQVTSNIFAYASAHPLGPPGGLPCRTRYSLIDEVADAEHTTGEGNVVSASATFFVDRAGEDFHLGANSPAHDVAEPGLQVTVDHEGRQRSTQAPDIGAYEAL